MQRQLLLLQSGFRFGSVWFALLALRCLCFWFRRWFAFALAWVPVPVPGPVSSKQSTDCPLCPVSTVHRPASGVPTSHRFVLVRFVWQLDGTPGCSTYVSMYIHTYISASLPANRFKWAWPNVSSVHYQHIGCQIYGRPTEFGKQKKKKRRIGWMEN